MLIGKLRKLVKKSYLPEKPLKRYNKNEFNNDVVVIDNSINVIIQANGYSLVYNHYPKAKSSLKLNIIEITSTLYHIYGVRVGDKAETIETTLKKKGLVPVNPTMYSITVLGRAYAYRLNNIVILLDTAEGLITKMYLLLV